MGMPAPSLPSGCRLCAVLVWFVGVAPLHALDWKSACACLATLSNSCIQIPMGRLLLETDSPDGLPQVRCASRRCSCQEWHD